VKPLALIVGGTGFVGRHLVRQLSDRYSIIATGRDQDIRDSELVLDLVSRSRPEIVVNLAAITTVRETLERPRETYEIGIFGLFNLLTALRLRAFRGRFLLVSSSEVYGFPTSDELPLTEAAPLRPMSPYSVAKAAAEMLCHQWAQAGDFDILLVRPFTHIGPGQSDRFAVAKFAREIAGIMTGHRPPIIKVGSLRATRDLTDVRDLVQAYDLILHRGQHGQIYNVCTGREIVMRDVLDELIRISGKVIEVAEDQTLLRKAEQQRLCGSYAALSAATGWAPEIPLNRTLSDVLAFALDQGD
jgi:GDP-4-dehydro-6-deoxy-D-mannose reductase